MKAILTLSLFLTFTAYAGKLEPPSDMQYPNVLPPEIEFGGISDPLSSLFGKIEDIAYLSEHELLVSESTKNSIYKVNLPRDNEPLKVEVFASGNFKSPKGIFVSKNKVAMIDRLQKEVHLFDHNGELKKSLSIEEMFSPWDIAIIADKAFITDNEAGLISAYSISTGKHLFNIDNFSDEAKIVLPLGISANEEFIVVANSGENQLIKFDASGKLLKKWGSWGSYGGQMATPYNIDISDDTIYLADQINHRLQAFNFDGEFLYQWARHPPTAHEGNGRVHYPTSIAVSPDSKQVAVCEVIENRCQLFGGHVTEGLVAKVDDSAWWEKATRFHYGARPMIHANVLAVSEPDTHSVLIFRLRELEGNTIFPSFVTRVGGQGKEPGKLIQPSGILVNEKDGSVWISDRGNLRLQEFSFSDKALPLTPLENEAMNGNPKMAMGSGSNKFVRQVNFRDIDKNKRLDVPKSEKKAVVGEPSAMVRLKDGSVLMVDPMLGKVNVLNNEMSVIGSWGIYGKKENQLLKPLDIAVSPDEKKVYIVDEYSFRIKVFDTKGTFLHSWGGPGTESDQFITPFGIAIDSVGNVFVSDTAKNEIKKFDASGKFITAWGGWGVKAGEFYKPKGIAFDDQDRLVVMDFGNHRGQIFDNNGKFIAMFGISENPEKVNRYEN